MTNNLPTLPTPEQVHNLDAAEAVKMAQGMNPPPVGLTDAEKLAALETYLKALAPIAKALRAKVTRDMGAMHVERVGAFLDGEKLAAIGYSGGRKTAKVTDPAAALKWCIDKYPAEIVKAINPAFLKVLLDAAKVGGNVGDPGVDPWTGEVLGFIEVSQGDPFVSVTTTEAGVARMEALANGFTAQLEAEPSKNMQEPCDICSGYGCPDCRPALADETIPDFSNRLENGKYES